MSPVLERARQSWIELTSHIPHVLVMRRQYPLLTMTEGEESCLGVVDFCAESIARRAESRKWAGQSNGGSRRGAMTGNQH